MRPISLNRKLAKLETKFAPDPPPFYVVFWEVCEQNSELNGLSTETHPKTFTVYASNRKQFFQACAALEAQLAPCKLLSITTCKES